MMPSNSMSSNIASSSSGSARGYANSANHFSQPSYNRPQPSSSRPQPSPSRPPPTSRVLPNVSLATTRPATPKSTKEQALFRECYKELEAERIALMHKYGIRAPYQVATNAAFQSIVSI